VIELCEAKQRGESLQLHEELYGLKHLLEFMKARYTYGYFAHLLSIMEEVPLREKQMYIYFGALCGSNKCVDALLADQELLRTS